MSLNNLVELGDNDIHQLMNQPIHISDAVSMFRIPLKGNTPPYDAAVIRHNNNKLDDWKANVLAKTCDNNSKVKAAILLPSWSVYAEGTEAENFHAHFAAGRFPVISDETALYWVSVFRDTPIEKLVEMGASTLQLGWQTLVTAIRLHHMNNKWDKVFNVDAESGSSSTVGNPAQAKQWSDNANHNHRLMKGEDMPFGLHKEMYNDMNEKFAAVMRNIPRPRK